MIRLLLVAMLGLSLAGCAADPPAPAGQTTSAGQPTTQAPPGRAVTFLAEDGVSLTGRVFGTSTTAVILSNMGDNDPDLWEAFAPSLADRGYLVLSYSFRYPLRTASFTEAMARGTVPDLRGAIAYVRGLGATRVVLIGASLGGITVGKVAGAAGAAAAVVVSAGSDLSAYGLSVTDAEFAAMTCPKLFIASEGDTTTPYEETRTYFEHSPQPKQFQSLAGDAHGVRIFATAQGEQFRRLILDFVTASVPS